MVGVAEVQTRSPKVEAQMALGGRLSSGNLEQAERREEAETRWDQTYRYRLSRGPHQSLQAPLAGHLRRHNARHSAEDHFFPPDYYHRSHHNNNLDNANQYNHYHHKHNLSNHRAQEQSTQRS